MLTIRNCLGNIGKNGSPVLNCLKPYLGRGAQALDIHCPGDLANFRLVIDLVSERKKRDGR